MKFVAVLGFVSTLAVAVSAQVANSSASVVAPVVAAAPTPSVIVPTLTSVSSCAVQSTFQLCLGNEQKYIDMCNGNDFACYCRWHKEKLTCYNNCPNDEGLARQEAEVARYCSMPGANVSIAPWTSSMLPTMTPVVQTSIVPTSANTASTAPTNSSSDASSLIAGQGALLVAGAIAAYVLF